MKNKKKIFIYLFVLVVLVGIFASTDVVSNLWNVLTGRGFVIPKESSIMTFKATVMNEGSGEWWVYGEDTKYFYYFTGEEKTPYIKIAKTSAAQCKNFDPFNHSTWCKNSF